MVTIFTVWSRRSLQRAAGLDRTEVDPEDVPGDPVEHGAGSFRPLDGHERAIGEGLIESQLPHLILRADPVQVDVNEYRRAIHGSMLMDQGKRWARHTIEHSHSGAEPLRESGLASTEWASQLDENAVPQLGGGIAHHCTKPTSRGRVRRMHREPVVL